MGQVIMMRAISTGGTESSLASVDIPNDGFLAGVEWACSSDYDTDNDTQAWQLSFGATAVTTNDNRQVISNIVVGGLTFTAGGSVIANANMYVKLPDVPVAAGERIFLHSIAAASVVGNANVNIHLSADASRAQVRRR